MAVFVKYHCNTNSNPINSFLIKNSTATDTHSGTGGPTSSVLRTYKRRKNRDDRDSSSSRKSTVVEKYSSNLFDMFEDKMVNGLVDIGLQNNTCEQICNQKINCHSLLNGSDDRCYVHRRTIVENISRSLSLDSGVGGIQGCIGDVSNNSSSINTNLTQKNCKHHGGPCHLERIRMSNGFPSQPGDPTALGTCEQIFLRIITLEKFAALCKMIMKNFPGIKVEELLDFSLISSRIKGGTYEHTPSLFSSDIQQIWRRLHSIGSEMVLLSQNLSRLSRDVRHELGVPPELDTFSDKRHDLFTGDSDMQNNREEPMSSIFCTCRQCGKLSDGSDCLVCDSCEEMFHLSCIQPTIKEIPHKSWYCTKCTFNGVGSAHEDCIVCERLNSEFGINGEADTGAVKSEENSDGVTEDGVHVFNGSKQLRCKMCECMVNKDEEFRVCEHLFCQYKYYHTRCLSKKQSRSYGPRWYCPSCLCRVCLNDKDDDDLVMCDGCDHGYHIYCMDPPRTSVPKGKWYCSQCDTDLQAIRRAKKFYQRHEKKKNKGKRVTSLSSNKLVQVKEEAIDASGGMNMLLTAAKTLKQEESTLLCGGS